MKIEAEIKSLKNILVGDELFYQIPDYQRPYSWDKDNLSDLLNDLATAYESNREDTYFCGSLVLVQDSADCRLDIIDGQQRITTFTIISCVIRDIYSEYLDTKASDYIALSIQDKYEKNKRKLKFLTNEKHQVEFEETVLKKIEFFEGRSIEREFPNNRYLQNANYVKLMLEEIVQAQKIEINDFVKWIYENVVLTVITCPSQDAAIQIFNVLNGRGMPLSPIDILKSSLMQKLSSSEDRTAFKAKWENINTTLDCSGFDFEGMLNTYLYYKLSSNPKSRADKELLAIFAKESRSALEIIKEIGDFSDAYVATLTEENKHLYCLSYLRHKIYWTSILTTATFTNYPDRDLLKKLLVAYYYQNWIAGATIARIKQTSFNIIKLIKAGKPVKMVIDEMQEGLRKYATSRTFKEEIAGEMVYGRKWDKAVLLLIEYFSSDNSNQTLIEINKKLHLEHVLPQSPTDNWKNLFSESECAQWTNSLANLTLLSMRKNVQAQNYSYAKKAEIYQNTDNVVTSFLITQYVASRGKWDIEELEARQALLLEKVMEHLDIFDESALDQAA